MTTYVALLYSIVLGEGRRVIMSELRATAEALGFDAPRTLVATGNLVFETEEIPVADLEARLERAFEQRFGRHVDIIVRGADGWRRLVAGNPFPDESALAPSHVMARVMRDPIDDRVVDGLLPYRDPGDQIARVDGDLWVAFAGKPSEGRLLGAMTPKRLGGIGTSRNWNTIRALGDRLDRRN